MKNLVAVAAMGFVLCSNLFAEDKGLDIRIINDKVSIQADAVPLGRLLRLFGQVTGMESKVPPELANRNVSVRFSNLTFTDAVQKIFEGQPLDYFVVEGKSIAVTGLSQAQGPATRTAGAPTAPPAQETVFVDDNPAFAPPQAPMNNVNPPAMIQTPFGAIPNPNARQGQQGFQQGIQQPQAPMVAPGQVPTNTNPFNSTMPGLTPSGNQLPGLQTSPFGQQQYPTTISPGVAPTAPNGFPMQTNPFPQPNPRPNP